jgi:3-keto-disaccharide hydrolase
MLKESIVLLIYASAVSQVLAQEIPPHDKAIVLFDGSSLDSFSFLRSKGLNCDPDHVFQVENGVTQGNDIKQYVNGKLANEGTDPFPAEGKILIQSEGAEVFFRNIEVYPLK